MAKPDSLLAMMAMAAATASAAATNPPPPQPSPLAMRHASRAARNSMHNRRQSINQLGEIMDFTPLPKGAPLPSPADGLRWRKISAVAAEIAAKWVHPPGTNQYETPVLHQVRAILYMNKTLITQSFVSHVSGVSQGSLSHYVRGLFRGNQKNIEDRLAGFVQKFASGELDTFLEEARSGSKPLRSIIYEGRAAPSASNQSSQERLPMPMPPPPPVEVKPPAPPPPPPQLQPAPWVRPVAVQVPQRVMKVSPMRPPRMESTQASNERAKRNRMRQISAVAKRKKRSRTPFIAWLEDLKPVTSVEAVERAFEVLVKDRWEGAKPEPLLVPIELNVEISGKLLYMYTQWDVNERSLSPELVAERIRRAKNLGKEFSDPAAKQIREALFDAGILCAPPPDWVGARRHVSIEIELNGWGSVKEEFEWDLAMGLENSPEVFAQDLCMDLGVPEKFVWIVAKEIRQKLICAHAIAFGNEKTRTKALKMLKEDDPLRNVVSEMGTSGDGMEEEKMPREMVEMDILESLITPILEAVEREGSRRHLEQARKREEEKTRRELEELRHRREREEVVRKGQIEEALAKVQEAASELQKIPPYLDFKPYLALRMGQGERPGVYTPVVFDRKRRRQTSFPMLQANKVQRHLIQSTPRSARRRRSSRREERHSDSRSQDKPRNVRSRSKKETTRVKKEEPKVRKQVREFKLPLKLRIKPEIAKRSRSGGASSKKRRRR